MVDEFLDLMLTRRQLGSWVGDRERVDLQTDRQDLASVEGRANLAQALINRLHTRQGELAQLGHPDYGSRLYQLIGELNNQRTRLRAELYIRECLAQESRIQEAVEIIFASPSQDHLNAIVTVVPVTDLAPLSFNLSLNLGA